MSTAMMTIASLVQMGPDDAMQWLQDNRQGFELVQYKQKSKRQRILEALEEGPSTASEIALTTGIESASCRALVSQFSQSKVVVPFGTMANPKGRDATIWMLPEQKRHQAVTRLGETT